LKPSPGQYVARSDALAAVEVPRDSPGAEGAVLCAADPGRPPPCLYRRELVVRACLGVSASLQWSLVR